VTENGFIFEEHPVVTQDGYKLKLFRIRDISTQSNAPVVFMQHGILDSADGWIIHHPEVAPAFQLVREGYDVWLGNQRGTKYSLGHETLDISSEAYWAFSFTEMGKYDAPAFIEYALSYTGQDKATFIGHSQGSTQMFYALSAHPEYWENKLNLFIALAPVTSMKYSSSTLFNVLSKMFTPLSSTLKYFN
jgi:pimeloyl-ACP methyl ester carboxylesterase